MCGISRLGFFSAVAIFRILLNPPFAFLMGDWRKVRSPLGPNFSYTYWANFFNRRLHGATVYLWAESLLPAAPWGSLSALHRNPLGVDGVGKKRAPEFRRESIKNKKTVFSKALSGMLYFSAKTPLPSPESKVKTKNGAEETPRTPQESRYRKQCPWAHIWPFPHLILGGVRGGWPYFGGVALRNGR